MEVSIAMSSNGYTNKEMLELILKNQDRLHDRIDDIEDKINTKISRQELFATSTLILLIVGAFTQM
jgi:hypothetical protein